METPFIQLPSGHSIAHYFVSDCAGKPQTFEGFDLWRDNDNYCYAWKLAELDLDYEGAWLLEIRTNTNGEETRDFLFVSQKDGKVDSHWFNQPVKFSCSSEEMKRHIAKGLGWFANLSEGVFCD
jgi:hypothetical protein